MSGFVQLAVWLHEYKLDALSSVLEEQGTSVEKRMQGMLLDMYEALVALPKGNADFSLAMLNSFPGENMPLCSRTPYKIQKEGIRI